MKTTVFVEDVDAFIFRNVIQKNPFLCCFFHGRLLQCSHFCYDESTTGHSEKQEGKMNQILKEIAESEKARKV